MKNTGKYMSDKEVHELMMRKVAFEAKIQKLKTQEKKAAKK